MKSRKFLALVTSALLLTAPVTSAAFADTTSGTTSTGTTTTTGTSTTDGSGTTTTTGGTTDGSGGTTTTGGTTDGSGTTTTSGGTGVCQAPTGDDGSDDGSGDGSTGTGTTDPTGGTTTGDPTAPTDGSTGTTSTGGTTTDSGSGTTTGTTTTSSDSGTGGVTVPQMDFFGGHGNNHKGPHHGEDGGWGVWLDGGVTTTGTSTSGTGTVNLCNPHDNGKHLGWTKKIQNMLNHLDQMRKAIQGFENELNMLMQWAQQNGSTTNLDALQQIQDSLSAEVQANEANVQDMQTLAEAQDKLHNVDGAVQTLEQALSVDPTNQDLYTQLSQKFVEKGDHSVKVFVHGKTPNFDVKPTILHNRTMVPLRAIGDALNAQVGWDATTKTITLSGQSGKTVKLQVNSTTATVNGQTVTLDAPATVVNGRTLVPLRALGNFFGLNVNWDSNAQMAVLN